MFKSKVASANSVSKACRCRIQSYLQKTDGVEKGRQIRNPNGSNAWHSLSVRLTIDNLQIAFAVYELIKGAKKGGKRPK